MFERLKYFIKKRCMWKCFMSKAILLFCGTIICVLLSGCGTTIELNDYVVFETTGYEGYGTVQVYLDSEAMVEDFGHLIEVPKGAETSHWSEDYATQLFIETCVDYSIDRTSKLSNGDQVRLKWNCKDKIAKNQFSCNLKYSDIVYTVEDVKEAQFFDPFDNISITFGGLSPQGYANIDTSNCSFSSSLTYVESKADNLKNGDTITIWVEPIGGWDSFVETFGMVPSSQEKVYEVQGLSTYIVYANEINDSLLEETHEYAVERIKKYFSSVEVSGKVDPYIKSTPRKIKYVGNYFLKKDDTYSENFNRLYLVYQVDSEVELDKDLSGEMVMYNYEFYYLLSYDNIYIYDGKLHWSNRDEHYDEFVDYTDVIKSSYWGVYHSLICDGYQTVEDVRNKVYDDYNGKWSHIKESKENRVIFK